MTAKVIDGAALAERLLKQLKGRIEAVSQAKGSPPLLGVLSIGGDPSAQAYLKRQLQACREAGIETSVQTAPASLREPEAFELVSQLAADNGVDGILVETPLPPSLSLARLLERLPPEKDVEGLTPVNHGRLYAAKSLKELSASGAFLPPTAHAVVRLLEACGTPVAGAEAAVVGRSMVVGRPAAQLLSCLDATVTLCHSRTKDLARHLKRADIVVAAAGQPGLVRGADLKAGAVVIDAGVTYRDKAILGDVDPDSAGKTAGWITPVPGGVGPVTVAMLLTNVVLAAERRLKAG